MRSTFRLIAAVLIGIGLPALLSESAMAQACTRVTFPTTWTVIAPTFNGTNQSYIRLFNGASASSTFSVMVVGSPSGCIYGSTNIAIPARASQQFILGGGDPNGILARAGAAALSGGDTSYALYLQNPDMATGYQHVTFNSGNSFFENSSLCRYPLNQVMASIFNYTQVLTNVHTTRLAAFPSVVSLHNYWDTPVTYVFTVVNAANGGLIGTFNHTAAVNASYDFTAAEIQSRLNYTPAANEFHMNVMVSTVTAQNPPSVLGQSIVNSGLQNAQINMSAVCAVNAPEVASSGGGSGGSGW